MRFQDNYAEKRREYFILLFFLLHTLLSIAVICCFQNFTNCSGSEHRLKNRWKISGERRVNKSKQWKETRRSCWTNETKDLFESSSLLPSAERIDRFISFNLATFRFSSLFRASQLNLFPFSVLLFVRYFASELSRVSKWRYYERYNGPRWFGIEAKWNMYFRSSNTSEQFIRRVAIKIVL